jgi:protease-4
VETVEAWIDGGPWPATHALEQGLIDGLAWPDQLDEELARTHGRFMRVIDVADQPQAHSPWEAPAQIAVIYIEGLIMPGRSTNGGLLGAAATGSSTVVSQLQQVARRPQIRAVVLRVDSGGGSAFASDEIWRAVELVREAGKPVVVSMGGVAASGGYYVAAGADAIWAESTTITGSIGIYMMMPVFSDLLDAVGVTVTEISRGRNAGLFSPSSPWDPVENERADALIAEGYRQFKERVATGRSMDEGAVEDVARGRVWSGERASKNGLVDHLGGFQDALTDARERAHLPAGDNVSIITFAPRGSPLELLAPGLVHIAGPLIARSRTPILPDELTHALRPLAVLAATRGELVWMISPWAFEASP